MLEDMKQRAGFTIVEIVITLTIMAILVSLAAVNLRSSVLQANDQERITDIQNIMTYQDSYYERNNNTYFPTTSASSSAQIETWYTNIDRDNLRTPGVVAPNYSLVVATNNTQTTAGVRPIPLKTTYVYQPLDSAGALCTAVPNCRKFNIFYLSDVDSTVQKMSSKNQ
jgi:prepilin-type N-terminal cleavage/methylation domain-containing protein